jgi:hypothetical protein
MAINGLKGKLHALIEAIKNNALLEDLLVAAESRLYTNNECKAEGLSKEDVEELAFLVNEEPEKDTISYDELKSSLSRWFAR